MKRFILILLIAASCQEEHVKNSAPDYVVFGHFYGFCVGEKCIEIYKLTDNALYEDINDKYPGSVSAYEGNYQLLDNDEFNKVTNSPITIPDELLAISESVIGQPDAADGGGIYFEISSNGEKRFWLIDKMTANIPESLRPFVASLEEKIELIDH